MSEPKPDEKPVLEAAAEVGLHPVTVTRWARTGRLEARWDHGRRIVSVERLRELLREPPRLRAAEASGRP